MIFPSKTTIIGSRSGHPLKMNPSQSSPGSSSNSTQGLLQGVSVIIVTYEAQLSALEQLLICLRDDGVQGLAVDNASTNQGEIKKLVTNYGFEFITSPENQGVAAAHNRGIAWAKTQHANYVVLLDQDSVPESGSIGNLLAAYNALPNKHGISAVGSRYVLPDGKSSSSFVRFGWFRFVKVYCDHDSNPLPQVDFLISSGTLFPMAVLDAVGPMKEELFIDHVDTDWFLRARSLGYTAYGCCQSKLKHALGERTLRIWLGRWRTIPIHKNFRYFFMFRNSLWLYRQSYAPIKWISGDIVRLLYIFLFSGLLVSSGRKNIACMISGIRAGIGQLKPAPFQINHFK